MSHPKLDDDFLKPLLPTTRVDRLTAPFRRFLAIQSSSGFLLMGCTILALVLANSPWSEAYESLWKTYCGVSVGDWSFKKSLLHVINDGLMTVFFFVVGLEIKREIVSGELRDLRQAALPILAAIGGMIAPALVFVGISSVGEFDPAAAKGWAIPMATDIAFVVGVLAIFGNRIPNSLKILLLTLAIVDDLGAVLIIALVFTETIQWWALILAGCGFALTFVMRISGVRKIPLYVLVGALVWFAIFQSGMHPTIAGVVLGLMTPAYPWIGFERLRDIMKRTLDQLQNGDEEVAHQRLLNRAEFAVREGVAPLERLESFLHPWVAFGIMPLFALANAGVTLQLNAITDPVSIAIAAGLFIGKPVGILLFSAIAIQLSIAKRPPELTWGLLTGGACLSGIGFTMSIFLAGLALPENLLDAGKLGTLTGSLLSMIVGSTILAVASSRTMKMKK
ncbi:Na+/H+ antiporter NhaA [Planctomicrobium sp. SH527]|uniref:Na+/H+ antiporter NhaA n=1 Tax=Planctomicrobium sp. SH527 TaxID=3448123 RepID=UPI003F5BEF34